VIVTDIEAVTVFDVTVNVPLVDPAGIVMLAGTVAAVVLLLDNVTTAPPDGAAAVSVAVPCACALPPVTLVGEIDSVANAGAAAAPCTVKLRVDDHGPAVPPLSRPARATNTDDSTAPMSLAATPSSSCRSCAARRMSSNWGRYRRFRRFIGVDGFAVRRGLNAGREGNGRESKN
jgi:hypothetical protein